MSSRSRRPAASSSGVHLLSSGRVITGLVTAATLGDGDLVLDVGAGPGTITAPLASTRAPVRASPGCGWSTMTCAPCGCRGVLSLWWQAFRSR
jgi:hypothetical protein